MVSPSTHRLLVEVIKDEARRPIAADAPAFDWEMLADTLIEVICGFPVQLGDARLGVLIRAAKMARREALAQEAEAHGARSECVPDQMFSADRVEAYYDEVARVVVFDDGPPIIIDEDAGQ